MSLVEGRKRFRFGPFTVNLGSRGLFRWRITSWGLRIGPWSWNGKSQRSRVHAVHDRDRADWPDDLVEASPDASSTAAPAPAMEGS